MILALTLKLRIPVSEKIIDLLNLSNFQEFSQLFDGFVCALLQ